jgi:hypothetical protein
MIWILLLATPACQHKLIQSSTKTSDTLSIKLLEKDSVSYKDTTYHTLADSSKISTKLNLNIDGDMEMPEIRLDTKTIKHTVSISHGKLTSECLCKGLEIQLKLKERLIQRLYLEKNISSNTKSTSEIVQEKFIPKWVKFFACSGGVFYLLLLIYIAFKVLKNYYKPFNLKK